MIRLVTIVCVPPCMHVHMCVCVHAHVCVCVCVHLCVFISYNVRQQLAYMERDSITGSTLTQRKRDSDQTYTLGFVHSCWVQSQLCFHS